MKFKAETLKLSAAIHSLTGDRAQAVAATL
jgi:hypothetical protein